MDGIELKIASLNIMDMNSAVVSCVIQTEIRMLCDILDKDTVEYHRLSQINRKAVKKHTELGFIMMDYMTEKEMLENPVSNLN